MQSFDKLIDIVSMLRGENGCDWDKEQSLQSIQSCLTEETYEVVDAIMEDDRISLREELGDLLLQVVFLSRICEEENNFSINDVINEINEKLIRRHPHVFGDSDVKGSQKILEQWEDIKKEEKINNGKERKSILDGIPSSMPEMAKSYRMLDKVSRVGFIYPDIDSAFAKIEEEMEEVREAYKSGNIAHTEDEIGDLLMVVINFARNLKIDPEIALHKSNKKLKRRFGYIEESARKTNKELKEMTIEEMDDLWNQIKMLEKENTDNV